MNHVESVSFDAGDGTGTSGMIRQDIETLLKKIVGLCREVFGEDLTGVYLHGSLAMGCFQPEKSDIDFLVVLPKPAKREQKKKNF